MLACTSSTEHISDMPPFLSSTGLPSTVPYINDVIRYGKNVRSHGKGCIF
jgi:hypothetical protein